MDAKKVQETLSTLVHEFNRMQSVLEMLPKTEGDLQALLTELHEADIDKSEHFKRFPRVEGPDRPAYECAGVSSEIVQADWHRVLRRFETVVYKLVVFARTTATQKPG